MFSPSESMLLQTMIQQIDPSKTDIIQNLKDEKYALALRKACGVKLYPFIMMMLDYVDELSIELNEKSSNGMTALDWLDQAGTGPFSTVHQTAREKLRAKGAMSGLIRSTVDFDKNSALFLGTDEMALAFPDSDYPVIGSLGAGQCIILCVYDSMLKKALLTHISGLDERSPKMVNTVNKALSSFTSAHSSAYIVGGVDNSISRLTHQKITQLLNDRNINIKYQKVFQGSYQNGVCQSESFAINASNGHCYSNLGISHFEYTEERAMASTEPPLGDIGIVENTKSVKSSEGMSCRIS
ncbi:MAG: hypothetical protein WCR08_02125 [Gammaproteobacteria bacterium]